MGDIYHCQTSPARRAGLSHAADTVHAGGFLNFPPDTLYAVGAATFDRKAVRALLAAKQRYGADPPSVLIGDHATAEALASAFRLGLVELG